MVLLRKILFPFAVLYGFITWFRNYLYDNQFLKSYSFPIPVIAVGNLSVGGTGKTPQIEYLVRLLSPNHRIAVLSRGYKRKSEGFILADTNSDAQSLGDEPYQFHSKFPEIHVAVDANRKEGIEKLRTLVNPDIILLDDAYQHRKVKAGFYVLLTAYGDLYAEDFMLPTGNLREARSGANRADVVVVTKCPQNLASEEMIKIRNKLKISKGQPLFFTFIDYDQFVYSATGRLPIEEVRRDDKLLIAGIAKPEPFFNFIKKSGDETLIFPDHHFFTDADIQKIKSAAANRKIITTEKDFVRLKDLLPKAQLYYLPVKTSFIKNQQQFDKKITQYVGKSTGNS
ncbi:MAG TPA: tetraacyldisaccharide 4'-kinase [Flavobacterium sp.]|jgi:tetraacyldisaccharide 4'-kinase